jgi:hypothetical protein
MTATTWPRPLRHVSAVLSSYALLFCIFFAPVLFTGRLLAPGDALIQYLPAFRSSHRLWEAGIGGGFPVAAEPTIQFFHPPALIASALGSWNAYVVAAYVAAAAGAYAYVFALTRSVTAASLSGIVFGMSGYLVAHLAHPHLVHTVAWVPIVLWAFERLRARRSRAWCVAAALGVAHLALAGHLQILLYALTLCGAYVLVMAPGSGSGGRWYRRSMAGAALLGMGIAAVQLLPTAELVRLSHRPGLAFEQFASFDLPFAELPQLVFPLLFGGGSSEYVGTWNLTETSGYLGFVPWAAAFVALITGRRRVVWFWAVVALAGLVLAMGDATPLAAWSHRLPVYRLFRCPARHLMETTLAVSVLAGLGVAELQRRAGDGALPARRIAPAVLVAVFLLAAVTIATYEPFAGGEAPARAGAVASRSALVLPLLFALIGAAALFLYSRSPASPAATALLFLVTALELASFGWSAEWSTQAPRRDVVRAPPRMIEYRERLKPLRQRVVSFCPEGVEAAMPNVGWLWDLPHAAAYMALVVGRHNDLLPFTGFGALSCDDNRVLDLFAARYFFHATMERGGFEWEQAAARGCGVAGARAREWAVPNRWATQVAIVGALAYSVHAPDGRRVGELRVTTTDDGVISLPIRAGDDLSEWAYERADVRPAMRHRRAPVFETSVGLDARGRGFTAQRYLAVFDLGGRRRLRRLEVVPDGVVEVLVERVSLRDERENESHPLLADLGSQRRWKLIETGDHVRVHENLRALPRSWLVTETLAMDAGAIRHAIETSLLPDGNEFDPRRTALVEEPVDLRPTEGAAPGTVEFAADEGTSVELATRSEGESFLVLADVDYPGWRATIDGRPARIHRTNYALRGVVVPAGEHRVRFEFRPWVVYAGLVASACSLVLLALYRFP